MRLIARAKNVRRTTLIVFALMLFLTGVGLARLQLPVAKLILLNVLLFTVAIFVLFGRKKFFVASTLVVLPLMLGLWRGSVYMHKLANYDSLYKKNVTVEVTAREDAVYSDRKQLLFSADNVSVIEPYKTTLVGNIEVEGFGVPMVYRGDRILVSGKFFPKRGDNQAGLSFANISLVHKNNSVIDKLRRKFIVGLQNVLPEPMASFALGLLIGQRNTLPQNLKEQLTNVGLIHIVAVSGYNLTIIIHMSQGALKRRSRYQSLAVSGLLIGLFLLLTGYSPSIVRAAVVSIIGLVMWYYGRNIKPMVLLMLSAALTVFVNPLYLWSSIGWYLSFTAFFGVLVLAPLLIRRFVRKNWQERLIPQVLSETLSAQICTLPIILYIFARLSLVSIIANLLVIPFVPAAMLASLISGIYGMIGPIVFGGLIVLPARLILQYMLSVTGILSSFPHASVIVGVSAWQMIIIYISIVFVTFIFSRSKRVRLTSTDKWPIF